MTTLTAAHPLPEIERFLAPISDDRPAGEWLRFDPLYDEVRLLREQDDASLPVGVWQRELKKADWDGVARLCESALESRTKDLQVAAWLTEALMQTHGFRGFDRGVRIVNALCATFWDSVYPAIEEGSVVARVSSIVWMADKLVLPLKSIALTAPTGEQAPAYAWREWENALYVANLPKAAQAPVSESTVTQSKFMVSVSLTPAAKFVALESDIALAIAAIDELSQTLTACLGELDAPSIASLRTPLVAMQTFVTRIRAERGESPASSGVTSADNVGEVSMTSDDMPVAVIASSGPIASRAEAYQRLREAADYLMRTEPHSPVPYLIRRAISWGNLSLAELLEELLQKNADLNTINALLGIRKT